MARLGAKVTIYEKRERLGGVVSAIIPNFRIDDSVIAKDAALLEKLGVKVLYNTEAPAVDVLKKEYDSVILAVGAYKRGELKLEGGEAAIQRWIQLVQQNAVMVLSMCILFIEEQNATCLLMNMN